MVKKMQENSKYGKVYVLGRSNTGEFVFFNYNANVDIASSCELWWGSGIKEKNKRKFFHEAVEMLRSIMREEDFLHEDQLEVEENDSL